MTRCQGSLNCLLTPSRAALTIVRLVCAITSMIIRGELFQTGKNFLRGKTRKEKKGYVHRCKNWRLIAWHLWLQMQREMRRKMWWELWCEACCEVWYGVIEIWRKSDVKRGWKNGRVASKTSQWLTTNEETFDPNAFDMMSLYWAESLLGFCFCPEQSFKNNRPCHKINFLNGRTQLDKSLPHFQK